MDVTIGELMDQLAVFDRDSRLVFGDRALRLNRLKHRGRDPKSGEEIVQLEFVEQVYRDEHGRLIAEDIDR